MEDQISFSDKINSYLLKNSVDDLAKKSGLSTATIYIAKNKPTTLRRSSVRLILNAINKNDNGISVQQRFDSHNQNMNIQNPKENQLNESENLILKLNQIKQEKGLTDIQFTTILRRNGFNYNQSKQILTFSTKRGFRPESIKKLNDIIENNLITNEKQERRKRSVIDTDKFEYSQKLVVQMNQFRLMNNLSTTVFNRKMKDFRFSSKTIKIINTQNLRHILKDVTIGRIESFLSLQPRKEETKEIVLPVNTSISTTIQSSLEETKDAIKKLLSTETETDLLKDIIASQQKLINYYQNKQ